MSEKRSWRLSLLSLLFLGACSDTKNDPVPTEPKGQQLYTTYCAFCHGNQGEGYVSDDANALSNQHFLTSVSDEFLRLATVHGRPGTPMSPWGKDNGGPLTDADVEAIVAYMRAWQTEPSVEVNNVTVDGLATRGAAVYNALCASCHGEDGEGVTAISLNNPWFHETASDGLIRYAIEAGRPGTTMPAYGDTLDRRQIDDLVAYIRSWKRPVDADPVVPYVPDIAGAVAHPNGEEPMFELREDRFVSIDAVHAAREAENRLMIIDARPVADFQRSHITGAIGIAFYDIATYADQLPRDTWIVTYCGCPHAVSGQAADALMALGFDKVAVLDEGFYEWEKSGYPVTYKMGE
jgi:cytochrome c oxidase cbb3-type subunit III